MEQSQIDVLNLSANELEKQAKQLRHKAIEEKVKRIKEGDIKEWLGVEFQSSSGLTEEFSMFARQYKRAITKQMPGYKLVAWSRGHFEVSGFFLNMQTANMVYFSVSDVRYFPKRWYNDILVRSAEHDKDYTGGSNYYSELKNIKQLADRLTRG